MSFLPAVAAQIESRSEDDPTRITLEFLLENAVGRSQSVSITRVVEHLNEEGVAMTYTQFQQTILAESRSNNNDYFIGSGNRGVYLIDQESDAIAMRDFYNNRIRAIEAHLQSLENASRQAGWQI